MFYLQLVAAPNNSDSESEEFHSCYEADAEESSSSGDTSEEENGQVEFFDLIPYIVDELT